MKKITKGLVLFAGLLAVPSSKDTDLAFAEVTNYQTDTRLEAIRHFFEEYDSPAARLAEDFLAAADHNDLDWRLLPAISFVESGGGKDYRNNNIFGWDNGKQSFRSLGSGIHYVAYQLGHSSVYRDKTLDAILATYNPRPEYARLVKSVMGSLGTRTQPTLRRSVN